MVYVVTSSLHRYLDWPGSVWLGHSGLRCRCCFISEAALAFVAHFGFGASSGSNFCINLRLDSGLTSAVVVTLE